MNGVGLQPKGLVGIIAIVLTSVSLAIGAALVARSGLAAEGWSIRWIEATGPFERVSAEQIRATAAPLAVGGFVAVDLERIRHAVETLPWVRAAGVRKKWPATLRIRVLEHEPLAQWNGDRLVSALGEVFRVGSADPIQGLPRLGGPDDEAPRVVRFFSDLSARLEGTGLDVAAVTLSPRGAWSVRLTGGIRLLIGRENVAARLDRLTTVIGDLMAESSRRLDSIDLRYTNGLAVRWADEVQALAGDPTEHAR